MPDNKKNAFRDKHYRESVWNNIVARIDEEEKVKKMPLNWIRYAAAAVVIIVAGAFWAFISTNKTNRAEPIAASYTRVINPTVKIYRVAMKDGSEVILYPNSEIIYRQPFNKWDRDITLKGKAFFEVAKNKTLPFRVNSKSVITTALGTSFTIVSDSLIGEVNVFLHTGKVVVEQNGSHSKKVYLTPGQRLSWDITRGSSIVRQPLPIIKHPLPLNKHIHQSPINFPLVFEQEPLSGVLKKIASGFAISLNYYPEELSSLYFSGTIKSADKPILVLQRIAALHDLTITEDKKGYSIRKN